MVKQFCTSCESTNVATEPLVCVDGGLLMLKERQRKDAEEVAAGLREASSLLVVGKGDLKGFRFTQNPESKFAHPGRGWGNLALEGSDADQ